jgi:16S rRNA (guanine1516-N2)-methyltransferase
MGVVNLLKDPVYRKKFSASRDLFFKALGCPAEGTEVWDLTAGLLVDTIFLLQRGLKVKSFEHHPAVLQEIKLALEETDLASLSPNESEYQERLRLREKLRLDRLNLEARDSLMVLKDLGIGEGPPILYLDPMFDEEARKASALPKKRAQWLRRVVPTNEDLARQLLVEAVRVTADRVVVKRPRLARELWSSPRHRFEGKSVRFDVYFRK